MDRNMLAAQLRTDEGVRLVIYQDSAGNATGGVGHLVLPNDHVQLGQTITVARCGAWLRHDIEVALATCLRIWPAFLTYPEEAQQVLANMSFNLGEPRLRTFTHLVAAVTARQWVQAAAQMRASLWAQEVGTRAERLAARLAVVTNT